MIFIPVFRMKIQLGKIYPRQNLEQQLFRPTVFWELHWEFCIHGCLKKNHERAKYQTSSLWQSYLVGGWLNQPIWKNMRPSNWNSSSPIFGVKNTKIFELPPLVRYSLSKPQHNSHEINKANGSSRCPCSLQDLSRWGPKFWYQPCTQTHNRCDQIYRLNQQFHTTADKKHVAVWESVPEIFFFRLGFSAKAHVVLTCECAKWWCENFLLLRFAHREKFSAITSSQNRYRTCRARKN